jgi:hypothetical protein
MEGGSNTMRNKCAAGVFFFLLLGVAAARADDLDSLLKPALDALYRGPGKPLVVSFGNFTYGDQNLASEFSRYLESSLALALRRCPQYELFARDKLDEILAAQELALSDLASGKDAIRIGQFSDLKALLAGRFFDAGKNVEVFLELVSIETGAVTGGARLAIPKTKIPRTVTLVPANYGAAVATLKDIRQVAPNADAGLEIKVWTDRGDGGTYEDGEELRLHFLATADCYIKVYHVGVDGDIKLIFPNPQQRDNRVSGNEVYSVPADPSAWSFSLGQPFGTEFIKVVASTMQFASIEESFVPLGKNSRGVLTRGLPAAGAGFKEAVTSFTIVPKRKDQ